MAKFLQKFVKFVENLTVIKIFLITIIVPTAMVILSIMLMEHKGTTYRVTHEVYFDISIDGESQGRVVIGLFGETVPKTVQNFYTLATVGIDGKKYQGTTFHRVIKKFMVQGGDVFHKDGMGRISMYGETFADENFEVNHATNGFIAMANHGPDTNGCQFYITTAPAPWLDGKHVVFGKVIQGQGIIHQIEHLDADENYKPIKVVKIEKSGSRKVRSTYNISDDPYNLWDWLKTISFPLSLSFAIIFLFNFFLKIIDKGIITEDKIKAMVQEEVARKKRKLEEEKELISGVDRDEDNVRRRLKNAE